MTLLTVAARRRINTTGRLLLFSDDFLSFDTSAWNIDQRTGITQEEEAYTDRSVNVRCENSMLVLQAWRENYAGKLWTSGQINSIGKHCYKYGRFEARMRMDRATGLWPAWWLIERDWNNPFEPALGNPETDEFHVDEIDILEALNANQWYYSVVHSRPNGFSEMRQTYTDLTQFHVFAVEWTSESLTFSLDGVDYWTQPVEFNVGQHMILNLALGGWAGPTSPDTPTGVKMDIDWVRVYAPEGDTVERVPTSLTIQATASSTVGQPRFYISPTISPADVHNEAIWWTSSNESVALVGGGWITSLASGTTTITATTWNGKSATCVLTIT